MTTMRPDVMELAHGKWDRILPALGIDSAYLDGNHQPCPFCGGTDRFRFKDTDGNGEWLCSGHAIRSGKSVGTGKGINLVMDVLHLDFPDAADRVREVLGAGLPEATSSGFVRAKKNTDPTFTRNLSRKLWNAAQDPSHQRVKAYLTSRGIDCLPEKDLGFLPSVEYWESKDNKFCLPAMVAPFTNTAGEIMALHRTYLSAEGEGKANVKNQRKNLSFDFDGCAIKLFEPVNGFIAITEGIETGLAVHELTGWPVWATGNTHLLTQVQLPDDVTQIVIMADNDPLNPRVDYHPGLHAAQELGRRLKSEGRNVKIHMPTIEGWDYNDVLMRKKGLK